MSAQPSVRYLLESIMEAEFQDVGCQEAHVSGHRL